MTDTNDFIATFLAEAARQSDLRVGLHLSTGARVTGWAEMVEGGVTTIQGDDGPPIHVRIPHIITAHYV